MGSIQDKVDSTCEIMLISIPDPNCLKKLGFSEAFTIEEN